MRMKAAAYSQYGDAAVISLVLEALPQVGSWDYDGLLMTCISMLLIKMDEIVLVISTVGVRQKGRKW